MAAGIIATAAGAGWSVHDGLFLAAIVAGGGLLWSTRDRKAWLVAAPIMLVGLVWSSLDVNGCSVGSKIRLFYEKLAGHLPYVSWSDVRAKAFSTACYASFERRPDLEASIRHLGENTVGGRKCELYQTSLGKFWIPAPGKGLLTWLIWEIAIQQDYESGEVVIRPGDNVIDCGAHVGVFTRYALSRGAGRVIAIEPEPTNTAVLEENFAAEIASGRVTLIKAGVWDRKDVITLSDSEDNSARHSFVSDAPGRSKEQSIPVLPLDDIVAQLPLDRVDFIKMDIEGAERRALAGARQIIARFKPKMAICTYHLRDDTTAIPAVVRNAQPQYQLHAKDVETGLDRFVTKVVFFHHPPEGKSTASAMQ